MTDLAQSFLHRASIFVGSLSLLLLISCHNETSPRASENLPENQSKTKMSLGNLVAQAEQYLQTQNYLGAASLLEEAIKIDSLNLHIHHALADAYLDGMQSRKALEVMERAASQFKDSIQTQLKLSEYQVILKQYPSALTTLNYIHSKYPSNADAFLMKGIALKEQGDTLAAIRAFQNATREEPAMLDAWLNAGQLAGHLQDQDALAYFDAGLRVKPDDLALLAAKAQYLAYRKEAKAAIEVYRQLLKGEPDHSQTYFELGLIYLDLDSLMKSKDHFNLAIQTEPLYSRAYFYRGVTFELLEEKERALSDYQQAYHLNPADEDAAQGIQRLSGSTLQ